MSAEFYFESTVRFGKHSPRILRRQNISSLLSSPNLFHTDHAMPSATSESVPSIERFHCALLFVDISGFTVLSQELALDDLKTHINAYFKIILDTVLRNGGEVIKFAGDALFIIWQSKLNKEDSTVHRSAEKISVEKAVQCGLEINSKCTNYKIKIEKSDSKLASQLKQSITSSGHISVQPKNYSESKEYFLNVHAGVSAGMMAGIDIGSDDRWEYFIIGDPLSEVAVAEGDASKGDIVMTASSHAILHPPSNRVTSSDGDNDGNQSPSSEVEDEDENEPHCSCGCPMTPSGCYKINSSQDDMQTPLPLPLQSLKLASQKEDSHDVALYETLLKEIVDSVPVAVSKVQQQLTDSDTFNRGTFFDAYLNFNQTILLQQMVRHTHEADRVTFDWSTIGGQGVSFASLWDDVSKDKDKDRDTSLSHSHMGERRASTRLLLIGDNYTLTTAGLSSASPRSPLVISPRRQDVISSPRTSLVNKVRRPSIVTKIRTMSSGLFSSSLTKISYDETLGAEMRMVITMFINLILDDAKLVHDNSHPKRLNTSFVSAFNFLPRTDIEYETDMRLLDRYQNCIAAIIAELHSRGGQLRQFIVDDKGTVCIGTFGLPGSVKEDNAAAAIEAAQRIIQVLKEKGIQASIGIASGKAYCGIVGSSERCEYAVMGPSVNLSARLMGKCPVGEIICDERTRVQDRRHKFKHLSLVHAKGYEHPVPTFQPLFDVQSTSSSVTDIQGNTFRVNLFRDVSSPPIGEFTLFGRSTEFAKVFNFCLLTPELDLTKRQEVIECVENMQTDMINSQERLQNMGLPSNLFDIGNACKLVTISGTSGIGKTSFLNLFRHSLHCASTAFPASFNITLFHGRCNDLSTTEPFLVWRPVLRQMMDYLVEDLKTTGITGSPVDMYDMVVDGALENAPERIRKLKALLNESGLVKPTAGDEVISQLTGQDLINAKIELLIVFTQYCITKRNRVSLVTIDDVQAIDTASLQLMRAICDKVKGAVIICGQRTFANSQSVKMQLECEDCHHDRTHLELSALNLECSTQMAMSQLARHGIFDLEPETFQRLFELSAGNPLFLHEMVNMGVHETLVMECRRMNFMTAVTRLRPQRIEQIVCYRFDQLEETTRRILKMATVVAQKGQSFNVSILKSMFCNSFMLSGSRKSFSLELKENQSLQTAPTDILLESILRLLKLREFIQIFTKNSTTVLTPNNTDVNESELLSMDFEFKTAIELETIYELMVDEQKASYHLHVAEYLEREQHASRKEEGQTAIQYFHSNQIAYHYQIGKAHDKAMLWHYRAAMILDGSGSYVESKQNLVDSYVMYEMMRRQAGLQDSSDSSCSGFQLLLTQSRAVKSNPALLRSGPPKPTMADADEMYQLFHGDEELTEAAVKMLTKLAQICLTMGDDPAMVSRLFDSALHILQATLSTSTEDDVNGVVSAGTGSGGEEDVVNQVRLKKMDYVFPVFSGLLLQYRYNRIPDDENHSNEAALCNYFMKVSHIYPEHAIHAMIARYCMSSLLYRKGRPFEALPVFEPILLIYDVTKHSDAIQKAYGSDRVLAEFASHASLMMMSGDMTTAQMYVTFVKDRVKQMKHLNSRAATSSALANTLVNMNDIDIAIDIVANLVEFKQNNQGFSLSSGIEGLVMEWLKVCQCQERICGQGATRATFTDYHVVSEDANEKLKKRSYLIPKESRKTTSNFPFYSRGLENMCIDICLYQAERSIASQVTSFLTPMECLDLALEYADQALEICNPNSSGLLMYLYTLLIKVKVLIRKNELDVNVDDVEVTRKRLYMKAVEECLERCVDLGRKYQLWYVLMQTGDLRIRLDLDGVKGGDLLREGLDQIRRKFPGSGDVSCWDRLVPSLNTLTI
eukprot:gene7481-15318_t